MDGAPDRMGERGGSTVLRVGAAVVDPDDVRFDVEVRVEGGRVTGIDACRDLTPAEHELVVTAGLVDAHTHLDLGALAGRVEAGPTFLAWVGRVIEARAGLDRDEVAAGVRRSAAALLDSGTTAVIDIDATGTARDALGDMPLRAVLLREIIDGSPGDWSDRSAAALAAAREALGRAPTAFRAHGVSPHGTHTVGDALLAALAELEPPRPVAVHWAETSEEQDWMGDGSGPFAEWLGPSPRMSGTERLARAGLLEGALLVHGNHPMEGEIERAAQARAAVVHCPGSHLFFGRSPFDAAALARAGVALVLGTDSWASNDALDMRREMALSRETLGLPARDVWRMATEAGASLLPWPDVTGRIELGAAADLAVFTLGADAARVGRDPELLLDHLTAAEPEVAVVVVDGHRVRD